MRRSRVIWAWIGAVPEGSRALVSGMRTPFAGRTAGGVFALAATFFLAASAAAQDTSYFRIGTGSTAGTYYPVGGLIAGAISNPPGSRPCERGGACGVPGLIAVAQSTSGSVDNVEAMAAGQLESAFSQADIAYWASTGGGVFAGQGPVGNLRTIANLYPEALHLVVRRNRGIASVADLRGKRVSLDREGSGTFVDALLVLKAYGLGPDDLEIVNVAADEAGDMMRDDALDAFFMVVGTPARIVSELAEEALVDLVPIDGPQADVLTTLYPFFSSNDIVSGTYFNLPYTPTLTVGAQWLVRADLPEEQVYAITRALWHDKTRAQLENGHPKGRLISLETALDGLGVPLHPGAERYYREVGALPNGHAVLTGAPQSE